MSENNREHRFNPSMKTRLTT